MVTPISTNLPPLPPLPLPPVPPSQGPQGPQGPLRRVGAEMGFTAQQLRNAAGLVYQVMLKVAQKSEGGSTISSAGFISESEALRRKLPQDPAQLSAFDAAVDLCLSVMSAPEMADAPFGMIAARYGEIVGRLVEMVGQFEGGPVRI